MKDFDLVNIKKEGFSITFGKFKGKRFIVIMERGEDENDSPNTYFGKQSDNLFQR